MANRPHSPLAACMPDASLVKKGLLFSPDSSIVLGVSQYTLSHAPPSVAAAAAAAAAPQPTGSKHSHASSGGSRSSRKQARHAH